MKVALILSPHWDQCYPSYSPALLASLARRRGHDFVFFDLNREFTLHAQERGSPVALMEFLWTNPAFVEKEVCAGFSFYLEGFVSRVLASEASVIGFTVYASNAILSMALARMIKLRAPEKILVFGGPSCQDLDQCLGFLRDSPIDAAIVGEGDRAFTDLLDAAEAGRPLSSVPGAVTRSGPDVPAPGAPAELEELPDPDFAIYDLERYPMGELTLETTRGCVRRCDFCKDWRVGKFRQKSAERVADQMGRLADAFPRAKGFLLSDSIVNGDMRRLDRLADLLIGRGWDQKWSGYAIVREEMTARVLEKVRRAGAWNLFYGVETGSDKVSRAIGKDVGRELNARVLRDTAAAGLANVTFLMVGHPSETEEDFLQTLSFVRENADSIRGLSISICGVNDFGPEKLRVYGIPEATHFWATRDGSNTFPVRVERFRRLVEAAFDSGVTIYSMRRKDRGSLEYLYEMMLSEYHLARRDLLSSAEHRFRAAKREPAWVGGFSAAHDY